MNKTILVAVDGSSLSHNALKFGISMAEAYSDQLRLINVQQFHQILGENIIKEAEALLQNTNIPYSSTIRIGTQPAIEIISEAKDEAIRCIVMGSKGKGDSNNYLGSISSAVLSMAPCPVVIIPSL